MTAENDSQGWRAISVWIATGHENQGYFVKGLAHPLVKGLAITESHRWADEPGHSYKITHLESGRAISRHANEGEPFTLEEAKVALVVLAGVGDWKRTYEAIHADKTFKDAAKAALEAL